MGSSQSHVDVTLIGGGIMSATLGMFLKIVRPDATIVVYERLNDVARESSDPWNNAGTGHAALCELHYSPMRPDGTIDIQKSLQVNDQFQLSLQFYTWLVEQGIAPEPRTFVNPVAHVGIARGAAEVEFLRKRNAALVTRRPFADTVFSDDPARIAEWLPLVMEGRNPDEPIAVTRNDTGTDVNFGALSRVLFDGLRGMGVEVRTGHEVTDLQRTSTGDWDVAVRNRRTGEGSGVRSGFVFVGAGGTALHLLQKSGIREIRGVGGFPVSGQFLRCTNPQLVQRHHAKVYGRPATGAPPMTAPHLDSRVIGGRRGLMFGPFAGFTPKFLKQGSMLDLARSIRRDNIVTMLNVARHELPLTAYLIRQVLQTHKARVDQLRRFVPNAQDGDWELIHAGQRVQVMRPTAKSRGVLQFGTEVITSEDGTISGLLGASPGASTATAIMLDVLKRCFPQEWAAWHPVLQEVVPSLGISLADEPTLFEELHQRAERALQLGTNVPV